MTSPSADSLHTSQSHPVLALQKVTCSYQAGFPAIQNISLSAAQGEIICLLGPSGCGKTTTLRAIAGFETLVSGEIYLNGQVVSSHSKHIPPERRRIGMVFQDYALFPHLRVVDNIAFGLTHLPSSERLERVKHVLSLTGLSQLERRFPHELSGGQQQRVALARALAPQPVLLLLDEPFSNLDPDMTYKMRGELHQLLKETKTTAVLVTHDHEEAFTMADHVAVLQEGSLAQFDTPENIYHLPTSQFVAEFVGQADFVPGVIEDGVPMTEIGQFPKPEQYQGGKEVWLLIRPDDIGIADPGKGTATIESRQFRGSENLYTIQLASGQIIHSSESSTTMYSPGTPVELNIHATHTVLFERSSP